VRLAAVAVLVLAAARGGGKGAGSSAGARRHHAMEDRGSGALMGKGGERWHIQGAR
jgi:hypothetical protein